MTKKLRLGDYELTISGCVDTTGHTARECKGFTEEEVELQAMSDAMNLLRYYMFRAADAIKERNGVESKGYKNAYDFWYELKNLANECEVNK